MQTSNDIELLFTALDEGANLLKDTLNITYLEALAEVGENIFHKKVIQDFNSDVIEKLNTHILMVNIDEMSAESIRKAFRLAVLKGMKEGTQAHHVLTPDAVSIFISYLVNKLVNKEHYTILDPAVGSANLLTTIINQTSNAVKSYGFEVDETLLKLAYVNANLQKKEIELFHEDSIKPMFIHSIDVVVSDLPIGYYPNQEVASLYKLNVEDKHPYVHHLMIEQCINSTKEGGILIFLIPNNLFETEQAAPLHQFIKEQTVILGLLQLPQSMFKNESYGKSIFILQKNGVDVKVPRQALLAELPSFSRKEALADMIRQINKWMKDELNIN